MTINGSTNHSLWNFKLEAYEESYSIENNTSRVIVQAYIGRNTSASYMWGAQININVSVTGCSSKSINYSNSGKVNVAVGQWILLGSTYFDVTHNADGSKSVTVSASFTNNISPASGSASGTLGLTNIPRATTPTLNVSKAILGQTSVVITTKGASTSLTHKIKYTVGSSSDYITSPWIPSEDLAKNFTNSKTANCVITCETYSSGKKIGEKTVNLTLEVSSSMKPIIGNITIEENESNMLALNWGVFVKTKSKLKIKIPVETCKGSAIKSCNIVGLNCTSLGVNNNVYEFVSETLTKAGNCSFTVEVKDGRSTNDFYSTKVASYNVVDYSEPVIEQETEALRCETVDKITEEGENLLYTFKGYVSEVNGKNTNTEYKILYKEVDSIGEYKSEIIVSNVFTINTSPTMLPNYKFDNTKKYEIIFSISDSFTSVEKKFILGTVPDLINFNPSGKSLAFGTVSQATEEETRLDIALDTNFTKKVTIGGREILSFESIDS